MCEMFYKIRLFIILIFILSGTQPVELHAQENPEVRAIQLFDAGRYDAAEVLFKQLLEKNPDDPALKYYYGAVRTENYHYSDAELEYLTAAGKDITPDRLNYYLGVQHHARENWGQALKYYNLFRMSVPATEQQEVELDNKIQLCFNKENPFIQASESVAQNIQKSGTPDSTTTAGNNDNIVSSPSQEDGILTADNSDDTHSVTDLFVPREALPNLPDVEPSLPAGDPVDFQVNSIITYHFTSQFQTEEGLSSFERGLALQLEQEKKIKETSNLRNTYKTSSSAEIKNAIASKILTLENDIYQLEEDKVSAFLEARKLENAFWEKSGPAARTNFLSEQEKVLEAINQENSPETEQADLYLIDFPEHQSRTPAKATPESVTYKIQIGAYSKGVPAYRQRLYNKLSKIRTIENYTDEKGIVVYTTGNLAGYEDALKMRNQVRQEGIEDAIVVPYFNGKRITLEQANELEAQHDI